MSGLNNADIARMRDQLFFGGPERNRRLSRYWLLLPLAAVIAPAGVVVASGIVVMACHRVYRVYRVSGAAGAQRSANDAGWSVTGVTATGDQVFIEATGPNPAPGLTQLRRDLNAAG